MRDEKGTQGVVAESLHEDAAPPTIKQEIGKHLVALTQLRARRKVIPKVALAIIILAFTISVLLGLVTPVDYNQSIPDWTSEMLRSKVTVAVLGILLPLIIFIQAMTLSREAALEAEVQLLATKERIAAELPSPPIGSSPQPASYFDSLVKINVDNLAEYYSLVKVHTNNSFRASLIAGLIGFALIIIGVIAAFGGADSVPPAKIAAASGVVIEFIAGVFFYLYNSTVRQLKDYHDSLLAVQNILLSFKLVSETEDPAAKRDMTGQMCSFLLAGADFPLPKSRLSRSSRKATDTPPGPPS